MSKMLMGELVTDEARAKWDALPNSSKLTLIHANQKRLEAKGAEAKRASWPEKPHNWDRGSGLDKKAWYHQVEREGR